MKKVWLENYPKGVVADVSATNQSLLELFERSFAKFSKDELITNMGVMVGIDADFGFNHQISPVRMTSSNKAIMIIV